jgi:hypothetical protein
MAVKAPTQGWTIDPSIVPAHLIAEELVNTKVPWFWKQQTDKNGAISKAADPTTRHRTLARIAINGFTCNHETWDNIFEADGKRDEIFVRLTFASSIRQGTSSWSLLGRAG